MARRRSSLRLVPPVARRPSVFVDMDRPVFTCPWTISEMQAAMAAPVPQRVLSAMYIAAWARAEHCGLNIIAGRLEPHCRYEPSAALYSAVGRDIGSVVGALGFGVPLILDNNRRAVAASWPVTWGRCLGKWGAN
jgi:hypothetical protein